MGPPYSCLNIWILVGLAIGCCIIAVSVPLATLKEECGSVNGEDCYEDKSKCTDSSKCFCPSLYRARQSFPEYYPYFSERYYCEHKTNEVTHTGEVVYGIFGTLSSLCLLASIVLCCWRCCCPADLSGPQYVVVAPGPYPQGGPQYPPPAPGQYPQGGPQYPPPAPGQYPQGGPQYASAPPELNPKGGGEAVAKV